MRKPYEIGPEIWARLPRIAGHCTAITEAEPAVLRVVSMLYDVCGWAGQGVVRYSRALTAKEIISD